MTRKRNRNRRNDHNNNGKKKKSIEDIVNSSIPEMPVSAIGGGQPSAQTTKFATISDPRLHLTLFCSKQWKLGANVFLCLNKKKFSEAMRSQVSTRATINLPFALRGIDDVSLTDDEDGVKMIFISIPHPAEIAAYNIGYPEVRGEINSITLTPDNWGATKYTRVLFSLPHFEEIPENLDREFNEKILGALIKKVNWFLDIYCLVSGNSAVHYIAKNDVLSFEVWHHVADGSEKGKNFNIYHSNFPFEVIDETGATALKNQFSLIEFDDITPKNDMKLIGKIVEFSGRDSGYKLAYSLLAEARRSFYADNIRLAAIQACSAVEASLFHYIESQLRGDTSKAVKLVLERKQGKIERAVTYRDFEKDDPEISFNQAFNELLSQVLPNGVILESGLTNNINLLRKTRNEAIHQPHKFQPIGLSGVLSDTRKLIDLLAQHHPAP